MPKYYSVKYTRAADGKTGTIVVPEGMLNNLKQYMEAVNKVKETNPDYLARQEVPKGYKEVDSIAQQAGAASGQFLADIPFGEKNLETMSDAEAQSMSPLFSKAGYSRAAQYALLKNILYPTNELAKAQGQEFVTPDFRPGSRHIIDFEIGNEVPNYAPPTKQTGTTPTTQPGVYAQGASKKYTTTQVDTGRKDAQGNPIMMDVMSTTFNANAPSNIGVQHQQSMSGQKIQLSPEELTASGTANVSSTSDLNKLTEANAGISQEEISKLKQEYNPDVAKAQRIVLNAQGQPIEQKPFGGLINKGVTSIASALGANDKTAQLIGSGLSTATGLIPGMQDNLLQAGDLIGDVGAATKDQNLQAIGNTANAIAPLANIMFPDGGDLRETVPYAQGKSAEQALKDYQYKLAGIEDVNAPQIPEGERLIISKYNTLANYVPNQDPYTKGSFHPIPQGGLDLTERDPNTGQEIPVHRTEGYTSQYFNNPQAHQAYKDKIYQELTRPLHTLSNTNVPFQNEFGQTVTGPEYYVNKGYSPEKAQEVYQQGLQNYMKKQGRQFANGGELIQYEGGGTHEQNPNGGIPVGGNALVEDGETNYGDYIYSDRIKLPWNKKRTFADESKRIESKYKDRPNDKASKVAMDKELEMLKGHQETVRQKMQARMQAIQADMDSMMAYGGPMKKQYASGGGIHINPEHEGDFTAKAKAAGMGVQEYAAHVLAAKEGAFDPSTRKQANFARNASKWHHADGGDLQPKLLPTDTSLTELTLPQNYGQLDNSGNYIMGANGEWSSINLDPAGQALYGAMFPQQQTSINQYQIPNSSPTRPDTLPVNQGAINTAGSNDPMTNYILQSNEQGSNNTDQNKNPYDSNLSFADKAVPYLPGLAQAATLIGGPAETQFQTFDPNFLNLEEQRKALKRQAGIASDTATANIKGSASGAGQALSNMVTSNAAINQNLSNQLAQSYLNEATANTQIGNQANQMNTDLANQEFIANEQNKAKWLDTMNMSVGSLANAYMTTGRDQRAFDINNQQNQLGMDAMNQTYRNYSFVPDGNGSFKMVFKP